MQLGKAIPLFLSGYFATCQRSPKTISAYTIDLEQFATFLGERRSLEAIRPEVLEDWAAELKEAEYASASIRRKFASLKVFFNYWVRRETLDRSPLWKIRLDLAPEHRLPPTLSLREVQDILKCATSELGSGPVPLSTSPDPTFIALRNLTILELLFATGIRIGELVQLKLSDYRPHDPAFIINGKGARQRLAFLPDKRSRERIASYIDHRENIPAPHTMLFLNTRRGPLSTQQAAAIITTLSRSAGIERRITPHMFRHTVATLLLRNGADIRIVQEFLGHATITTTQKYTHVSKKQLRTALEVFHPNRCLISELGGREAGT